MELQAAFRFFADQVVSARKAGREVDDIQADVIDEGGIMVYALDQHGDAMATVNLDSGATERGLRKIEMLFFHVAALQCGLQEIAIELRR
jgi:hypothetical protein